MPALRLPSTPLPWLAPGEIFPKPEQAWGLRDPIPGLLAAGGSIDADTLGAAYAQGIFPWFNAGQPILWWSPDPRMVLLPENFRLHRSLRKVIARFRRDKDCAVRFDTAFRSVIEACAQARRRGQSGTWIHPEMMDAYEELHARGMAHSVETWVHGQLVGGLYCVALGKAVFGESMFSLRPDASKLALGALVAFCRRQGIAQIDCQQNTAHLASLGAAEISRARFLAQVEHAAVEKAPVWEFTPNDWACLLEAPLPDEHGE